MADPVAPETAGESRSDRTGLNRQRVALRVGASLIVLFTAAGTWFLASSLNRPVPDTWGFRGFQIVIAMSLLVLGVLVGARRPDNAIGWLLLGAGVVGSFQFAAGEYSRYAATVAGGPDALAPWAAWLEGWVWVPVVVALSVGLFATFPDGRLPSRRWRWVVLAGSAGGALVAIGTAFAPAPRGAPRRGGDLPGTHRRYGRRGISRCTEPAHQRSRRPWRTGRRAAPERPALCPVGADGAQRGCGSGRDRDRRFARRIAGAPPGPPGDCRVRLTHGASSQS